MVICHDTTDVHADINNILYAIKTTHCSLSALLHQVKNAMLAGAKGIIMFSDPADYWAAGVQVEYSVSFYVCVTIVNTVEYYF